MAASASIYPPPNQSTSIHTGVNLRGTYFDADKFLLSCLNSSPEGCRRGPANRACTRKTSFSEGSDPFITDRDRTDLSLSPTFPNLFPLLSSPFPFFFQSHLPMDLLPFCSSCLRPRPILATSRIAKVPYLEIKLSLYSQLCLIPASAFCLTIEGGQIPT